MFTPVIPSSGIAGWRILTSTEESQRDAHATSSEVEREIEYFKKNIGDVRSVDDLLADRRLLEVAMTAYGLGDEIDKTAFIEKVLEGGTDDSDSFANSLNDERWVGFAAAFGFGDAGSGQETTAFEAAVVLRYNNDTDPMDDYVDPLLINAYRQSVGDIASVEDLIADDNVLNIALSAFGLERGYYNDDHFRALLTSDLSDPNSYANTVEDGKWTSFAAAFSGLGDGEPMTTISQFQLDIERELERADTVFVTQATADASETRISEDDLAYFRGVVETITSGQDLVDNARALKVAKVAFGVAGDSLSDAAIASLIDDAIAGDLSAANAQSNYGWTLMAESLATTVNGGAAARYQHFEYAIEVAMADEDLEYVEKYHGELKYAPEIDAEELAYFRENAKKFTSAEALVNDERALTVALTAFGLEDSRYATSFLQSVLEEDITSSTSFYNLTGDEDLKAFIAAFAAQTSDEPSPAVWQMEVESRLIEMGAPDEDLQYVRDNFDLIESNLDFVLDTKLMGIVMSAFGIDEDKYTSQFFLQMIIADPTDPKSLLNKFGDDGFKEMADVIGSYAASAGNTGLESFQSDMIDLFKTRSFEEAVGEQDNDMRLALYFRDTIGEIASSETVDDAGWFKIMGDTPLRTVVDAAFGLPDSFAELDVDAQFKIYKERSRQMFGTDSPAAFLNEANVARVIDVYLVNQQTSQFQSNSAYGALTMLQESSAFLRSLNQRA